MSKITKTIAERFIERAAALELRGKKRDDAALDYFVGAAAGAELAGDEKMSTHIGTVAAMIVAIRGYMGVAELARETDGAIA